MTEVADKTATFAPARPDTPASRLIGTLAGAGAAAGALLVFVFDATQPAILAHKAKMLQLAVHEVLSGPARYDTLYLHGGGLTATLPDGVDEASIERVYLGYDDSETKVGFAIAAGEPGFQDVVKLIFGYNAATRSVLGMKVLESRETPGLGDKIEKDRSYVSQFAGAVTPLASVKPGRGSGADNEIDAITGATISSNAVVRIINNAVDRWRPHIEAFTRRNGR